MKKIRAALVGVALTGLFAVPAATASPDNGTSAQNANAICTRLLNDSAAGLDRAFNARDLDKLIGYYDNDATLINPFGALRAGKDAIKTAFGGLFSSPFNSTVTTLRTVVKDCKTAEVVQDFLLEDPSDGSKLHFINSISWTFEQFHWKVLVDQSTNLP
jgi:ketosteroid isomerase-like protein